jgi:hypothetical protein
MAEPTSAELDDVAAHLLLFKPDATSQVPLPAHDASLDARYAALTTDHRFSDLAFAVVEYGGPAGPKTFLHNPDVNWDIGSCGKVSIMVAALALLKDIRSMTNAGVITDAIAPAKFDALLRYVWGRHSEARIKRLSTKEGYPLPSKMVDLVAVPADFRGTKVIDFAALHSLLIKDRISVANLATTTFRQRLHLAMGGSVNKAARACQGTVGIAFINAILTKLGLYDEAIGVGMRIAGPYSPKLPDLPDGWRQPRAISRTHGFSTLPDAEGYPPPYVATARTLSALMSAIVEDSFLDVGISAIFRDFLLVRPGFSYGSYALQGIEQAAARIGASAAVTEEYSKVGVLYGLTEFVHVVSGADRYSLIILGLLPQRVGAGWVGADKRAIALGDAVHSIIKAGP